MNLVKIINIEASGIDKAMLADIREKLDPYSEVDGNVNSAHIVIAPVVHV